MNTISLVGHAGRDPESRYFESGTNVCNFTIAVNRRKKDEEPDWFNLEIWGKTAEVATNYVRKGSLIGVTGSIHQEKWTDRASGEVKSKWVVRVDRLDLLGSRRDSDDSSPAPAATPARRQAPAGQPPAWNSSAPEEGDDIPF
jgi:single-strand DNA-binding protein